MTTQIVEYSATEAGLMSLRGRLANIVYQVDTNAGMEVARRDRRELVRLRTSLEEIRQREKAPILERGRLLDAEAKRLTAEIVALESPIDAQILAEERRKAEEKAAREAAERARVASIISVMDSIKRKPLLAIGASSDRIRALILDVETAIPSEPEFQEYLQEAISAQAEAIAQLQTALAAAEEQEAEAEKLKAERAELARQQAESRRQQAEQEAKARQEREAADKASQAAREAQEAESRAQIAAERARLADETAELTRRREAADRAEAERLQREESVRLAEEQKTQAEQRRIEREAEQAKRIAQAAVEESLAEVIGDDGRMKVFVAAAGDYRSAVSDDEEIASLFRLCSLHRGLLDDLATAQADRPAVASRKRRGKVAA